MLKLWYLSCHFQHSLSIKICCCFSYLEKCDQNVRYFVGKCNVSGFSSPLGIVWDSKESSNIHYVANSSKVKQTGHFFIFILWFVLFEMRRLVSLKSICLFSILWMLKLFAECNRCSNCIASVNLALRCYGFVCHISLMLK